MKLPHVVRVHESAGFVEAAGRRAGLGLIADVPFAEDGSAVILLLEHLPEGGEAGIQSAGPGSVGAEEFGARGVAAAEQRRAGGGADRLRDVEIVEAAAFVGEAFNVGRGVGRMSEGLEVGPSGIVQEDDDEVRGCVCGDGAGATRESERGGGGGFEEVPAVHFIRSTISSAIILRVSERRIAPLLSTILGGANTTHQSGALGHEPTPWPAFRTCRAANPGGRRPSGGDWPLSFRTARRLLQRPIASSKPMRAGLCVSSQPARMKTPELCIPQRGFSAPRPRPAIATTSPDPDSRLSLRHPAESGVCGQSN